jgi:mxaK protein
MKLSRRDLTRAAIAVLVVVLVAIGVEAAVVLRARAINDAIASEHIPKQPDDAVPELRFAEAAGLAASGATDTALNRYRALQGDTPLGQAARYNAANLLLRQAIVVRAGPAPGQAIALIELAKESYREVLRRDPDYWSARYNLERAQRLLPDPDPADDEATAPRKGAERAATTMRGYSPGLP